MKMIAGRLFKVIDYSKNNYHSISLIFIGKYPGSNQITKIFMGIEWHKIVSRISNMWRLQNLKTENQVKNNFHFRQFTKVWTILLRFIW